MLTWKGEQAYAVFFYFIGDAELLLGAAHPVLVALEPRDELLALFLDVEVARAKRVVVGIGCVQDSRVLEFLELILHC